MHRVLTQYRESPRLLGLLNSFVDELREARDVITDLPLSFIPENAVGEQLTFLGERMGLLREHTIPDSRLFFGFEGTADETSGFDEGVVWRYDAVDKTNTVRINDDEIFRRMLRCRAQQVNDSFSVESLNQSLRLLFDSDSAVCALFGAGKLVLAPRRDLTDTETSLLPVFRRILPVQLGVRVFWHLGSEEIFGFGEGWGGFDTSYFPDEENDTGKVFGFGDDEDVGGFSEPWLPSGTNILTVTGDNLLTADGVSIVTREITRSAYWEIIRSSSWLDHKEY